MNQSHFDDNQVMDKVCQGKVEMLAILFERYHKRLYNYLLRLTGNQSLSEDLVQDVFVRILKYRQTYAGKTSFVPWMYQIARNAHFDFLRSHHQDFPLESQYDQIDPSPEPEEILAQEQEQSLFEKAINRLAPKKREILMMSRFHQMKYQEIADVFQCSIEAIKTCIHRSMIELKKIYGQLKGGVT